MESDEEPSLPWQKRAARQRLARRRRCLPSTSSQPVPAASTASASAVPSEKFESSSEGRESRETEVISEPGVETEEAQESVAAADPSKGGEGGRETSGEAWRRRGGRRRVVQVQQAEEGQEERRGQEEEGERRQFVVIQLFVVERGVYVFLVGRVFGQ